MRAELMLATITRRAKIFRFFRIDALLIEQSMGYYYGLLLLLFPRVIHTASLARYTCRSRTSEYVSRWRAEQFQYYFSRKHGCQMPPLER